MHRFSGNENRTKTFTSNFGANSWAFIAITFVFVRKISTIHMTTNVLKTPSASITFITYRKHTHILLHSIACHTHNGIFNGNASVQYWIGKDVFKKITELAQSDYLDTHLYGSTSSIVHFNKDSHKISYDLFWKLHTGNEMWTIINTFVHLWWHSKVCLHTIHSETHQILQISSKAGELNELRFKKRLKQMWMFGNRYLYAACFIPFQLL